ncbi:MAG TPA: c-type cytochrome, partial [Methylomirabilota bacterium]|nr:c-type cytochrome [Methylomirabilota bacterium]
IVRSLLDLLATVPADDTHLRYVVRKSIRDQLRVGQVFDLLVKENLNARDQNVLTDVALGVTNAAAATFLLRQLPELSRAKNPQPPIADILKHAARYAPGEELDRLADFAGRRLPAAPGLEQRLELERQFALFKSIDDGLQQRGLARPEAIRVWGTNLVWTFFSALDGGQPWSALPHEAGPAVALWDLETRRDADGRTRQLISSLPHGESQTGILCSPEFPLPPRLSFWLCGHDGFPDQPPKRANLVRLRLVPERGVNAAPLGDVLASAPVPRHDVARRVTWELPAHAGQGVVLEAVDGDTGAAYAWLAFGDFEPALPQLRPAEFAPRRLRDGFAAAADAAVRLQMRETAPVLARFATPAAGSAAAQLDGETLGAMARAFVALAADQAVPALARALTAGQGPAAYREGLADLLASQNSPAAQAAVLAAMKTLPLAAQEKVAITLASAKFSAETLLGGIESGAIAPRVLHRHSVINRLKASQPRDWEARVRKLTASLAPQDEARDRLIASRRAGYDPAKADPVQGSRLFVTHCAACHQIDGRGGLVGPQLNGIGQRGLERLVEDVLDPNRNVDHAFRTTLLELKDGELTSGLFRREEGELVVLADSTGRELSVAKKDIAARSLSGTSLMPENFGELLSAEDFNHLMAFLLAQRVRP